MAPIQSHAQRREFQRAADMLDAVIKIDKHGRLVIRGEVRDENTIGGEQIVVISDWTKNESRR